MSSLQLYPEVIDASAVGGATVIETLYLPLVVEGQGASPGTATVGVFYRCYKPSDSEGLFGKDSSLDKLVKFILGRGVNPVIGVASSMTTAPTLAERQAVWSGIESDSYLRIRLTDASTESDLAALADSCENAELLFNKQICFAGLPAATAKDTYITAATAISSRRCVLVGPAVYDVNGTLLSGTYAAAAVAAEVAMNQDISDDLDTAPLANLTGIEKDGFGLPVFRKKVVSGSVQNDHEDLLIAGVSPLRTGRNGGAEITHLRMAWTVDRTFDSLMTRLIVDQVFLDVRQYLEDSQYLRRGNTEATRESIRSGVEALLQERGNWIQPKSLPDGTVGYVVTVISSPDNRQVQVSYEGIVVRGIFTILVNARLEIPV